MPSPSWCLRQTPLMAKICFSLRRVFNQSAAVVSFLAFNIFVAASASGATEASIYDLPSSQVAIQPRKYEMSSSFLLSAGYMPADSFNRGVTLGASVRQALSAYFTLEGTFVYVYNQTTSLQNDLNTAGVTVQNASLGGVLDYPKQIYLIGLHYAPFYSKSLLFNSKLIYSEDSFFLGVGSLNFNQVGSRAMIAPGLASRFYIGASTAIVGYFRDYFYSDDHRGVIGIVDFGIAFEYKLGGGRSSEREGPADETRSD